MGKDLTCPSTSTGMAPAPSKQVEADTACVSGSFRSASFPLNQVRNGVEAQSIYSLIQSHDFQDVLYHCCVFIVQIRLMREKAMPGQKPPTSDTQVLQIVDFLNQAGKVSDSVRVAVYERPD